MAKYDVAYESSYLSELVSVQGATLPRLQADFSPTLLSLNTAVIVLSSVQGERAQVSKGVEG